ncbi:hypothetical protein ACSSS7_003653 [Eimeria intestinalis]
MTALLNSQPPQDFTDPLDDARIAQTLANLDAYRLTASGCLAEPTLNLESSKRQQIRDLAQWASAKVRSFNACLEVLFAARREILSTSKYLLHGAFEAFQLSALDDSPECLQAAALKQAVEDALMRVQSEEIWKIDKHELIHFLEERLDHLKKSGSLFETDADKAEIAVVASALAEARGLPENFVINFEHLRRPSNDSTSEAAERFTGTRGPQRTLLGNTPDASHAQESDTSDARLRLKKAQESDTSDARLRLKKKLSGHIKLLKQMEVHQSHLKSRILALREAARVHQQTQLEKRSSSSPGAQSTPWVEHQVMHVKLHGLKVLRIIEDSLNVFDGELRTLLRERAVTQEQLALAKLKHLEHLEELLVIRAMEPRTLKVQHELLNERAECQRISDCIVKLEATALATSTCIENCHAHDTDIRKRLREAIGPRHPQYAALIQIFERKVLCYPAQKDLVLSKPTVVSPSASTHPSVPAVHAADFGEEEYQQEVAEDMVVDVCPLGCDMALYEALLELRVPGKVRPGENQPPSHRGLVEREVTELYQDAALVAEDLRQLKRSFTAAKKEFSQVSLQKQTVIDFAAQSCEFAFPASKLWEVKHVPHSFLAHLQSSQRLADLRSTFKEVQLVRFGMSLTLEQVEAAAKLASRDEKQARAKSIRPAFERDVEAVGYKQAQLDRQQEQHDALLQRLKDLTKRHAALSRRFASSRGNDLLLSQQLRKKAPQQVTLTLPTIQEHGTSKGDTTRTFVFRCTCGSTTGSHTVASKLDRWLPSWKASCRICGSKRRA